MATTEQGAFDFTYHHIDAPTKQDNAYWEKNHVRILSATCKEETFRDPLVAMLSHQIWTTRRKLDGANLRVQWNGEQVLWNGKTNNFVCNNNLRKYMQETFPEEIFEERFGRSPIVTIFGEHMGPKVQGNELGLDKDEIIIFDVNINGFWQEKDNVREIAKYFNCRTCYDFMEYDNGKNSIIDMNKETFTLNELILAVASGLLQKWEGVVATPTVECRNQRGERVIVKVKTKDYYRGE